MPALVLLIIWLLAEAFVALKVAEAIGVLLTILLLIISWPIGGRLMRAEGRVAWRRFAVAAGAGRPPGREALDGALVVVGGGLLLVPGFISDVLGLCLLIPPVRALARRALVRHFQSRLLAAVTRFGRPPGAAYDVDSTAADVDRPQLHRR